MSTPSTRIALFQGQKVRKTLYENAWWFVIEDVVLALTDSSDPKQYIRRIRERDPELEKGWVQFVRTLDIQTKNEAQVENALVFSTIKRYNKSTFISTIKNMTTITLQDIKSHGAGAIPDGKVVYLIVNSQTKSVMVPPAEYEMLIDALEELEDIRAIESRRGEKIIEWDEMFPKDKK